MKRELSISYLKKKNLRRISINVTKEIRAKVKAACEVEEISVSDWVRRAILRQLYEFEQKDKP